MEDNKLCTIYLLKNKINNKLYVGQTWQTLKERWYYGRGYRGCQKMHRAINKYGKENFYYEILLYVKTQESADLWEDHCIQFYNTIKNGYNLKNGGAAGKMSEEVRRKKSEAQMGPKNHMFGKTGPKNHMFGKKHSEETKRKIREAHKKNRETKTVIPKIKLSRQEIAKKISKANKGKKRSDEFKNNLSKIRIGEGNPSVKLTWEQVNKIRFLKSTSKITDLELSKTYGVSRSTITLIINNKKWKI